MQKDDDNRDLLEMFSRAAKIPRAKLDEALKKHSVMDLIRCPAFFNATPAEARRVNDIKEFTNLFGSVKAHEMRSYQICGPDDAYRYLAPSMDDLKYERFDVLLLDTRHRVIKRECMSEGGLSTTGVDVQKLLRSALLYNASSVMFAHNHPSGDSKPSPDDVSTTKSLIKAFELCSIDVLDHIVIGKNEYASLKMQGFFEEKATYQLEIHKVESEEDRER